MTIIFLAPPARALAIALAMVSAAGCREAAATHVAELAEITSGSVDKRIAGREWAKANVGDRFSDGDAIRTPADGSARIKLIDGGGFKVGPRSLVHFGEGAIDQLEGQVEAEGGDVSFGDAVIKQGSGIKVSRDAQGNLVVDVMFGTVSLTRNGETIVYGKNDQFGFDVSIGKARIQRPIDAAPPPPIDAGVPDAAPPPEADLVSAQVKGRGARMRPAGATAWEKLPAGDHSLPAGAAVSLRARTSIQLARGGERAAIDGAAELTIGSPDGPLFEQSRGDAQINARAADVSVAVPGGTVTARAGKGAGSSATVAVGKGKAQVRARSGLIDVVGDKGGKETIQIGEWIELSRTGTIEIFDRAPAFAHFELSAGASATVHDPAAPTNVRFAFGDGCSGAGIVELAAGGSFSSARISRGNSGSAIMRVKPGSYRYRVRCLNDGELGAREVVSGRLRVNRDAGTKPLPTRAPVNTVDADGRVWNVLYQNLLPRIGFQWPAAPEAGPFTLTIRSEDGKTETIRTHKRLHFIEAGKLAEGTYRYWFADETGARSKESTLRIGFDNAAMSGYIRSPKVRERWNGSVKVEGATVKGGSVSVAGQSLALDSQYRFSTTVAVGSDQRAIAIRFTHPKSGTHYYIRRGGVN